EVIDAHRVPRHRRPVLVLDGPVRLDLVLARRVADAFEPLEHRLRVGRDPAARPRHGRYARDAGFHLVLPGVEPAARAHDRGGQRVHGYSVNRATTSGQPGTVARSLSLPVSPIFFARGRLENKRSHAWAIASGSGWVTSPVSPSVTNSSGPPASASVTTGR